MCCASGAKLAALRVRLSVSQVFETVRECVHSQNVQAVTFLNVLLFSWKAVAQVIFVGRVSGSKS